MNRHSYWSDQLGQAQSEAKLALPRFAVAAPQPSLWLIGLTAPAISPAA